MKKLLPIGDRVVLKVELIRKKQKDGTETVDISREAKVEESSNTEIKKGSTVYYNPRGCIQVETMNTKKHIFLIVDAIDVYGIIR